MRPSTFRADLDPRLEAICLKMMARKIEERYGSMREAATALSDFLKNKGQQSDHASQASFQTVAVANSPRHATVKAEEQRQTLAGQRTATPTSQTVASLRGAVQSASLKFKDAVAHLPGWAKGVIGTVVVMLLIYSISLPFRADRKPVPDVPNLDPPTASAASQAKKPKLNALGQDPVKLEQYYVRNPAARPPTPVISDAPSPPEAPSTPAASDTSSPAKAPFPSVQAKAHQQAWAKHLGTAVETTNGIGMKMVLIPPGDRSDWDHLGIVHALPGCVELRDRDVAVLGAETSRRTGYGWYTRGRSGGGQTGRGRRDDLRFADQWHWSIEREIAHTRK